MRFEIEGKTYSVNAEKLMMSEAEAIESLGMDLDEWADAIRSEKPKMRDLRVLVWIGMTRSGEALDIATFDVDIATFKDIPEPQDHLPKKKPASRRPPTRTSTKRS